MFGRGWRVEWSDPILPDDLLFEVRLAAAVFLWLTVAVELDATFTLRAISIFAERCESSSVAVFQVGRHIGR